MSSYASILIFSFTMMHFCIDSNSLRICVVGGGPAGLLFVERLLQNNPSEGIEVELIDLRGDPRSRTDSRSFSILASTSMLKDCDEYSAGLSDFIKEKACNFETEINLISANSSKKTTKKSSSYFTSQRLFSSALLDKISMRAKIPKNVSLTIKFNTKCISVNPSTGVVYYNNSPTGDCFISKSFDLIVGADSTHSVIRNAITSDRNSMKSFEKAPCGSLWKCVVFNFDSNERSILAPCFVRHKSFTGFSSFLADGKMRFAYFWTPKSLRETQNCSGLQTIDDIVNIMQKVYGNAMPIQTMRSVAKQLLESKPSTQSVFKINEYAHSSGKVVLIGDAAHSMLSFLGQGMVCAIQDVNSLYKHLEAYQWKNISQSLLNYSQERVPEGHAITDLNYLYNVNPYFLIFDALFSKLFFQIPFFKKLGTMSYCELRKKYSFWVNLGKRIEKSNFSKFQFFLENSKI